MLFDAIDVVVELRDAKKRKEAKKQKAAEDLSTPKKTHVFGFGSRNK